VEDRRNVLGMGRLAASNVGSATRVGSDGRKLSTARAFLCCRLLQALANAVHVQPHLLRPRHNRIDRGADGSKASVKVLPQGIISPWKRMVDLLMQVPHRQATQTAIESIYDGSKFQQLHLEFISILHNGLLMIPDAMFLNKQRAKRKAVAAKPRLSHQNW
jgi:hypothetical protein